MSCFDTEQSCNVDKGTYNITDLYKWRPVGAQVTTPKVYHRLFCHPQELGCELTLWKQLSWQYFKSSGGFCGILKAFEGVTAGGQVWSSLIPFRHINASWETKVLKDHNCFDLPLKVKAVEGEEGAEKAAKDGPLTKQTRSVGRSASWVDHKSNDSTLTELSCV